MPKKLKLKHNLLNLLLASTSHGLPNVFRTERTLLKILWLSLFIVSISFGLFSTLRGITNYFEFEVVTKFSIIDEIPIQFPKVSFFNLKYYQEILLEDILIDCYFNDIACNASDFEAINIENQSIGYFFKGNQFQNIKSFKPGKTNGLQIELFKGKNYEFYGTKYEERYNRYEGFYVTVGNFSTEPKSDGIEVTPGFSTNLIINRAFSSRLAEPYNKCIKNVSFESAFDSELFRSTFKLAKSIYSQKDCLDICLSQRLLLECNVTSQISNTEYIFAKFYRNLTINECFDNVWNDYLLQNINEKCLPYCPLECDSVSYQIATSFSKFPNEHYAKILMESPIVKSKFPDSHNITFDDLLNNMIAFNVHYENLKYTSIREVAKMDWVDLVSNIGGILGAFIGISLLSFFEIVEFLLEIIFVLCEPENSVLNNN